jgi:hypothetical protein
LIKLEAFVDQTNGSFLLYAAANLTESDRRQGYPYKKVMVSFFLTVDNSGVFRPTPAKLGKSRSSLDLNRWIPASAHVYLRLRWRPLLPSPVVSNRVLPVILQSIIFFHAEKILGRADAVFGQPLRFNVRRRTG